MVGYGVGMLFFVYKTLLQPKPGVIDFKANKYIFSLSYTYNDIYVKYIFLILGSNMSFYDGQIIYRCVNIIILAALVGCSNTPVSSDDEAASNANSVSSLDSNAKIKYGEFLLNGEKTIGLFYEEHNDSTIIVEGDILLSIKNNALLAKQKMAGLFGKDIQMNNYRWSDAIIPYNMDNISNLPALRKNIREGMDKWEENSPIKFVDRSMANCPLNTCVTFQIINDGGRPASYVGNQGDNKIWFNSDTELGTVIHELGHKIGLGHEYARQDGVFSIDPNITISEFISESGYYTGYDGVVDYGSYDYASVMNYLWLDKKERLNVNITTPSLGDYLTVQSLYSPVLQVRSFNDMIYSAKNLEVAGSSTSSIRFLRVLPNGLPTGAVFYYQVYHSTTGWTNPKTNGEWLSNGSSLAIQDLVIWLRNAPGYIPIYRAYSTALGGWLPWQANGDYAAKYHIPSNIQKIEIKVMNTKMLQNRAAPYLCADVNAGITDTDGQNIHSWGCSEVSAQQFRLTAATNDSNSRKIFIEDGVEKWITHMHIKTINDKCIVYKWSSKINKHNIEVGNCSNSTTTMWFYDSGLIRNVRSKDQCLTIDSNPKNGSNLTMENCSSTTRQKWDILETNTARTK